jgi:RNase P/RNase MRP subunit p30
MNADFFLGARNDNVEQTAKALGFDRVYFIKETENISDIQKDSEYDGVLIKSGDVALMRRLIDKASAFYKIIFVLGTNDLINRAALEHKKASALVSPEFNRVYDYVHYRNSGLNQVLCKIARDNNKMIMINFGEILSKEKQERAVLLGRIIQNIELCRKYKVKLRIANFSSDSGMIRSVSELGAFCRAIGMTPGNAASVLSF